MAAAGVPKYFGNAVKYTPAGGKLELMVSEKEAKEYGYGRYDFVFCDNGIGMDEEFVKRIFEPFSRAEDSRISKVGGTGLGMTIAQNIVRMMGGNISIQSQPGVGSRFTVTLLLKLQHVGEASSHAAIQNQGDLEEVSLREIGYFWWRTTRSTERLPWILSRIWGRRQSAPKTVRKRLIFS